MTTCQRCKINDAGWDKTTRLMGIVVVKFCQFCTTEFEKAAKAMPGYELINEMRITNMTLQGRAQAGDAPSKQEWADYMDLELQALATIGPHIEAWACHVTTEAFQEPVEERR